MFYGTCGARPTSVFGFECLAAENVRGGDGEDEKRVGKGSVDETRTNRSRRILGMSREEAGIRRRCMKTNVDDKVAGEKEIDGPVRSRRRIRVPLRGRDGKLVSSSGLKDERPEIISTCRAKVFSFFRRNRFVLRSYYSFSFG